MQPDEPNQPDKVPPFRTDPIHPDLLAWVRQTFDEEEFLRDAREVLEGRGKPLEAFIDDIKAAARGE